MSPTISQVRVWKPEAMLSAAIAFARSIDEFDDAVDGVVRSAEAVLATWQGIAADSARTRVGVESTIGNRVAVTGLEVVEVLNASAERAGRVREFVLMVECELNELGVSVGDTGEILTQREVRPDHEVLAKMLRSGLEQAGEIDRTAAESLRGALRVLVELSSDDGDQRESRVELYARIGKVPRDAAGLAAFWQALSTADKAALLGAQPSVGSRDGMPAATRDFFNQERLDELIATDTAERDRLAARRAILDGEPHDFDASMERLHLQRALDAAQTRVAGYEEVSNQLGRDSRAMLMDIDARGRGAIALNNPDTATHVTTLVPGTGTNLVGIGSEMNRTKAMLAAAEDISPGSTHSVIAWVGYDAPQNLAQATDSGYAVRGGAPLCEFQSGLRASHLGEDSHNTVVGHSYGTTTVGIAASGGRALDADALVFLASPGTSVDHVSELSLTGVDPSDIGNHVFSTKGATDPVPQFANMGGIVNDVLDFGAAASRMVMPLPGLVTGLLLDGVGDLVEQRVSGPFGSDPTDVERFGGRIFSSDPGTASWGYWNPDTHSEHWDVVDGRPNQSLLNLARIISNQGDRIS